MELSLLNNLGNYGIRHTPTNFVFNEQPFLWLLTDVAVLKLDTKLFRFFDRSKPLVDRPRALVQISQNEFVLVTDTSIARYTNLVCEVKRSFSCETEFVVETPDSVVLFTAEARFLLFDKKLVSGPTSASLSVDGLLGAVGLPYRKETALLLVAAGSSVVATLFDLLAATPLRSFDLPTEFDSSTSVSTKVVPLLDRVALFQNNAFCLLDTNNGTVVFTWQTTASIVDVLVPNSESCLALLFTNTNVLEVVSLRSAALVQTLDLCRKVRRVPLATTDTTLKLFVCPEVADRVFASSVALNYLAALVFDAEKGQFKLARLLVGPDKGSLFVPANKGRSLVFTRDGCLRHLKLANDTNTTAFSSKGPNCSDTAFLTAATESNAHFHTERLLTHICRNIVKLWGFRSQKTERLLFLSNSADCVEVCAFSVCGRFVFVATTSGKVEVFRSESGLREAVIELRSRTLAFVSAASPTVFFAVTTTTAVRIEKKLLGFRKADEKQLGFPVSSVVPRSAAEFFALDESYREVWLVRLEDTFNNGVAKKLLYTAATPIKRLMCFDKRFLLLHSKPNVLSVFDCHLQKTVEIFRFSRTLLSFSVFENSSVVVAFEGQNGLFHYQLQRSSLNLVEHKSCTVDLLGKPVVQPLKKTFATASGTADLSFADVRRIFGCLESTPVFVLDVPSPNNSPTQLSTASLSSNSNKLPFDFCVQTDSLLVKAAKNKYKSRFLFYTALKHPGSDRALFLQKAQTLCRDRLRQEVDFLKIMEVADRELAVFVRFLFADFSALRTQLTIAELLVDKYLRFAKENSTFFAALKECVAQVDSLTKNSVRHVREVMGLLTLV